MVKKSVIKDKSFKILTEYSIILIYQYTNLSLKEKEVFKKKLKKLKSVKTFVVSNKILKKILEQKKGPLPKENFFFQGPTFLVTTNSIQHLLPVKKLMKNFPNFILVGGFFNNQPISYHTFKILFFLSENSEKKNLPLIAFLFNIKKILISLFFIKNQFHSNISFFSLIKKY